VDSAEQRSPWLLAVLKGGQEAGVEGRYVEHVKIQFLGPVPPQLQKALNMIARREERLPEPLEVDLEFEVGTRLAICELLGWTARRTMVWD
jgi:hypothetical protein